MTTVRDLALECAGCGRAGGPLYSAEGLSDGGRFCAPCALERGILALVEAA